MGRCAPRLRADLNRTLLAFSETLADGTPGGASDTFQAVLSERASLVHRLVDLGKTSALTTSQAARLRRALDLGEQARFPVAAKRENLRARLGDLRHQSLPQPSAPPTASQRFHR